MPQDLAKESYKVFQEFDGDTHAYGRAAGIGPLKERAEAIQEDLARVLRGIQARRFRVRMLVRVRRALLIQIWGTGAAGRLLRPCGAG